jgi:Domain of unknown function (DUF1841)
MRYDALKAPDPEAWLALDEQERRDQVTEYHRRHHLPMGESAKLHGAAHVIVENQVATGDPPAVREALARLMGEGLDRHDALHAVGSVVMGIVFDVVREKGKGVGDINAKYADELAGLTAESWRSQRD